MKTINKLAICLGMMIFVSVGMFGCADKDNSIANKDEISDLAKTDDTTDYCEIYD
jgi:hypothetical protein